MTEVTAAVAPASLAEAMEMPAPQATVLFVDDEPGILSALRRLFRSQGYRILLANSGAEGLATLEAEDGKVDLVVSDMRMPVMDGARFLEQVCLRWPHTVRILLTGYSDMSSTVSAINRGEIYRYIAKPWDDQDLMLTVHHALDRQRLERENQRLLALTQQQNDQLKEANDTLEQKVAARTAELSQLVSFLEQAQAEQKRAFLTTVRVFSSLIELRGGVIGGHSRRVTDHARTLAQKLGLDDAAVQDVVLAALLHDIGKIGLPDDLLAKPFNLLNGESRAQVMRHPVVGQNVLMGVEQLKNAAQIIRHHHECYDGSGYPDRLAGAAIPRGARILSVASDFDALQIGTLVQRPLKANEALAFLIDNKGKRYDPRVVEVFVNLINESHKGEVTEAALRLSAARPGMVLARDLLHRDGYLLLAKGFALSAPIIEQLVRLEESENQNFSVSVVAQRQEAP